MNTTNIDSIRSKLHSFKNYYSGENVKCFVVLFYQNITSSEDSKRVVVTTHNGLIECVFHTKQRWAGGDPNVFWARLDDDLIVKMIEKVDLIINKEQRTEMIDFESPCNICGGELFINFNGRIGVQCASCNSLERHRLVRWTLEKLGYVSGNQGTKRALHLAPEEMTHRYLAKSLGVGLICSDLVPSKYPHAQCLKLALPEGFDIFPDSYFDLILHNHVLEHIPGNYRDHLTQFLRLLRPEGHMVFTLPGISRTSKTVEGGENLPSDDDRVRLHGQSDHYKSFGYDLIEWFSNAPGVFGPMEIPAEMRVALRAPADSIFVYSKI